VSDELKAYVTWVASDGPQEGCILVFAYSRNEARSLTQPYWSVEYINVRARREPEMDQYALLDRPHFVWSNDDLPQGVSFYYDHA
jgi:hypothetical protein